ncbi:MAG: GNAT family N-acetyltransferase [Bacteroidia bacterium]|nr:GNAT family N-acetyltransferase [Bacteroidia bacterium]
MEFFCLPFSKLNVEQLYNIYKLRSQVFVVEQNCAYQDVDEKDPKALHVLMLQNNQLVAYSRILPPGVSYAETAIGRVVVDPAFRGKNIGKELMKYSIHQCLEQFKNQGIVISAQTYLLKFYTDLGFVPEGEIYPEDEIPHIKMRLKF